MSKRKRFHTLKKYLYDVAKDNAVVKVIIVDVNLEEKNKTINH